MIHYIDYPIILLQLYSYYIYTILRIIMNVTVLTILVKGSVLLLSDF